MHRFSTLLICIALCLLNLPHVDAQNPCKPAGWANENGGTTGGGTAPAITVSSLADLRAAANATGAAVIYVSGTMGAGVATRVPVSEDKTIIGLPGATLNGGFDIKRNNVIIRNMIIRGPGAVDVDGVDCITIDGAQNVWIDHCDIADGQDGNLDIVNGANYVTVSWTKFSYSTASVNHQFCNLLGNDDAKISDRGKIKVTMQYNWWTAGCKERMPRVRFGQVHVANNLFDSRQAANCVRAGIEANILVESNYFDNVKTPIDLYQNNFTAVTQRNNFYNAVTGNRNGSGTAFTPPYTLDLSPAANIKAIVGNATCGAGATLPAVTSCGCINTNFTVTTTAAPAIGGTINGGGSFASGTIITLTATAAPGYSFVNWAGDATGTSATAAILVNSDKAVIANFEPVPDNKFVLTSLLSPAMGGTVSGAGTFDAGTSATLTATPAAGYLFTGWSGDTTVNGNNLDVPMYRNKTIMANFEKIVFSPIPSVEVYPNPTHFGVTVGFNLVVADKIDVQLIDAAGRVNNLVRNAVFYKGYHSYKFSLFGKLPGMYIVLVTGSSGFKQHAKLVIQ